MSRLGRLLPSVSATRRSYSIFSSKSGGGRYFNSAKSSKVITPSTSKASSPSTTTSNAGASSTPDAPDTKLTDDASAPTQQQATSDARHPLVSPNASPTAFRSAVPTMESAPFSSHPILKPNEIMLHRFFALHRPCLLLSQPTSTLFESATPSSSAHASGAIPTPLGTIDDPPMASPEADADAARRLSRSLVMNRVQNLVNWEETMGRLGLHEIKEPLPEVPSEINMDSTKRKRRKKMKKHKLKKRRRLSRATRLRMGK
ncbi:hypothetical protein EW145_g402 [Phellinidium pouzarii]|uniref:Ribosomal protein mS38 C-terminal domain-containing protein n=1 Tax=Phellinidium pouzarii TaxID=167371 RepID=A0A4S4LIJ3_9AGAM|nr:hypothetical protein EW145_g402 [Phellinidium pouzarii]